MGSEAVKVQEITQVYVNRRGASLALDTIELGIQSGEFVSLVGPSGCGKTTLLSIIAGLLTPTKGSVWVDGQLVEGPHPKVGYMLQQDYLFPWLTIYQNVVIGLKLFGRLEKESEDYVLHLLDEMGLSATCNQYPSQLSGGMRQRAALVRTLSTKPDILLLDEPFSALDYQTKLQLEDLVSSTIKSRQKTAILVTHDISEAIAMSDRVIIMNRNPGTIRKELAIPSHIRASEPFHAREQRGFQEIFHEVWHELESADRTESQHD